MPPALQVPLADVATPLQPAAMGMILRAAWFAGVEVTFASFSMECPKVVALTSTQSACQTIGSKSIQ
jgi:hypothetical protein